MGIVAGLLVQNALKHLLGFGQVCSSVTARLALPTAAPTACPCHGNLLLPFLRLPVQVTHYLGYSSLTDYFPTMDIKPNSGCANALCCKRQEEWAASRGRLDVVAAAAAARAEMMLAATAAPLHETNEWGIEVVSDAGNNDAGNTVTPPLGHQELPHGLQYSMPMALQQGDEVQQDVVLESDVGVEQLLVQLAELAGT